MLSPVLSVVIGASLLGGALRTPDDCRPKCAVPGRCVVIDPGHPSEVNRGTTVVNGLTERDVNWRMARRLASRLERDGIEVYLTRSDSGAMMTNRARAEVANCAAPALFLRLHADAGPVRGFAVFHADREGRAQGVTGPPAALRRESRRWAEVIEGEMRRRLPDAGLPARGLIGESRSAVGAKQGALTGSIFARVPTVLIEMVVLTNRADARWIRTEVGQQALVEAMSQGVSEGLRERLNRTGTDTLRP